MRKYLAVLLVMLMMSAPALAEGVGGQGLILTGKVQAASTLSVQAPFGGLVKDFTLRAGDRVKAGDELLVLQTSKIYAPCDGIVRGLFAQTGDSAAFVQGRYGALCSIEPSRSLIVQTNTAQGHKSAENRFLILGQTVYLRCTNNSNRTGEGRIISVNGQSFAVEIVSGNLQLEDSVNIFRNEDAYSSDRLARGEISRVNPIAVTGEGALLRAAVSEGDTVRRGDLLFEMVSGNLEGMIPVSPVIYAPEDGVIASVSATAGQNVSRNQVLMTLYRLDRFQLVSAVSEMDAREISVGDKMSIEFDSIPGKRYDGVVSAVSGIGSQSDNYTEYAVYIDVIPDESLSLGMSGTAYPVK